MAEHNDLGKEGEKMGREYLASKGYKILAVNWRYNQQEIDIIALDKEELVVVEVKTRSSSVFGTPEFSVNRTKQRFLVNAATAYVQKNGIERDTRFDIISIISNGKTQEINHIENAFYPGL